MKYIVAYTRRPICEPDIKRAYIEELTLKELTDLLKYIENNSRVYTLVSVTAKEE